MRYALGIDIGGTKIAAGIVNEHGDIIQKEVVKSEPSCKEKMFSQVVTCVEQLLNHSSISTSEIYGMGAGVPGKVDREKGIAIFQNNLPWANFPFVERLQKRFTMDRIVMDNDVYMAAYAEWKMANLPKNNLFVYVTVSTGISCSIIQDGEFIRGAGFAGELGLVPVFAPSHEKQVERLETVAAGPAIANRGKELFANDAITTADVFAAYYGGNPKAREIVEEMVSSIAQAVYMINSLIDPHRIVFGGSVAAHNPFLIGAIKGKLKDYVIEEQDHILQGIEISQLLNDQGVVGAGLSVFDL